VIVVNKEGKEQTFGREVLMAVDALLAQRGSAG